MGWNEPYQEDIGYKSWDPAEAAESFRTSIGPALDTLGWKWVSPTMKARDHGKSGGNSESGVEYSKESFTWMIKFIKACWDHKNDNPPCRPDLIKAFSTHDYHCQQSWWENYYSPDQIDNGKNVKEAMKAALKGYTGTGKFKGGKKDWDEFIDTRNFWLTETNCNHDDGGFPTPQQACERITGQAKRYGIGSVRTIERLEAFERWAWWCFANDEREDDKNVLAARMTDPKNRVTIVGQAMDAAAGRVYDDAPLPVDCTGGSVPFDLRPSPGPGPQDTTTPTTPTTPTPGAAHCRFQSGVFVAILVVQMLPIVAVTI